mmetsp:Transcript_14193/g.26846  ORF Transcript_14193/g.26846 Transcript_14193/m.26846 type:complete len:233 (+) Transcript_14193:54-752(+)
MPILRSQLRSMPPSSVATTLAPSKTKTRRSAPPLSPMPWPSRSSPPTTLIPKQESQPQTPLHLAATTSPAPPLRRTKTQRRQRRPWRTPRLWRSSPRTTPTPKPASGPPTKRPPPGATTRATRPRPTTTFSSRPGARPSPRRGCPPWVPYPPPRRSVSRGARRPPRRRRAGTTTTFPASRAPTCSSGWPSSERASPLWPPGWPSVCVCVPRPFLSLCCCAPAPLTLYPTPNA